MDLSVRVVGLEQARAQLLAAGKKVDPVLRGALNTTATKSRSERYVKPLGKTIAGPRLRRALRVKRANSRRMNARIIPSSSGVAVVNYRTWGVDRIDATRARIWVAGPNGRKIAAGFVNPSSSNRLPLSTRKGRAKASLRLAQGPSVAYWFKQLSGGQTIAWVNAYLQQEFRKRMNRELSK